jgi:hypothetical protein
LLLLKFPVDLCPAGREGLLDLDAPTAAEAWASHRWKQLAASDDLRTLRTSQRRCASAGPPVHNRHWHPDQAVAVLPKTLAFGPTPPKLVSSAAELAFSRKTACDREHYGCVLSGFPNVQSVHYPPLNLLEALMLSSFVLSWDLSKQISSGMVCMVVV